MRNLSELDQYRQRDWEIQLSGSAGNDQCGCFLIKRNGFALRCIVSSAELGMSVDSALGWDHISVSTKTRAPTWDEMEFIKKLFAKPDETWVQFHVPESDHVNVHEYCLHLWHRPDFPRPPSIMV